ncbi:MAG: hypothetical protein GXY44_03090 [Phycisphaerales bacterium]|nr:hypothetical protein [Phycisphaerales bacterium]
MFIVTEPITVQELKTRCTDFFETLIKGVVDVRQRILAVDAEMHADIESMLTEECSSKSDDLWGINFYPDRDRESFVEYNSLINIKPHLSNKRMDVGNPEIRELIDEIVREKIIWS